MNSLFKQYEGAFKGEEQPKIQEAPFEYAYSPFALQDAIGEKNVKKVWIEYEKLRLIGIEAESIIHNVINKIRDMALINQGANEEDLGVKNFTFIKSKKHLKNWQDGDLKNFYTKLVTTYHESRMESGKELDIALEKLLLSI